MRSYNNKAAKARFIEQVKREEVDADEIEDIGAGDIGNAAAETKAIATGDPATSGKCSSTTTSNASTPLNGHAFIFGQSTRKVTDVRYYPPCVGRFYYSDMASTDYDTVGADAILRQLDAEADSTSIEVTLYLPWGMATGITVPGSYFGHFVAHFFNKNNADDIAGRLAALEAEQDRVFIHLRKATCCVAGEVVRHDSLRIRLSDVSAWTVAGVEERQPGNPRFP